MFAGCGSGTPPSDRVEAAIKNAVLTANTAMYEAGAAGADVVGIALSAWRTEETTQGIPANHVAEWTARMRFKEPLVFITAEVDGKRIVRVAADAGEELPFAGHVSAMHWEDRWEVNASASSDGDFAGPGAWKPIWDKAGGLTMGYPVVQQGYQQTPRFRQRNFEPLSQLQPCIVEGSPEHARLEAEAQERFRKAQAAAAEKERARAAELERQRAAEAERQRLAQEEAKRKQEEAAEQARLAAEAAQRKAQQQQHARLLAVLKPLQSPAGAVITGEAGKEMGTVVLEAAIDDAKLAVAGRAIDLRTMPFRELTFEGAVDARGAFTWKSSLGGDPVVYGASADKLVSRAGLTIAALTAEERAALDAIIARGKALGSAAATLAVETLDADAAKAREPQLEMVGLAGTVLYRDRVNAAVAPLFAADLGANKAYAWRNQEVVAIRASAPARGRALYLRGTTAASTQCIVTINGVHTATVASIPKLGGVLVAFPGELDVMDVRLQATGAVSMRTIGVVK